MAGDEEAPKKAKSTHRVCACNTLNNHSKLLKTTYKSIKQKTIFFSIADPLFLLHRISLTAGTVDYWLLSIFITVKLLINRCLQLRFGGDGGLLWAEAD
ncbi:hypothetical protein L1887_14570 [Cichorium endivia]|nr:hypothetical protein L1887_14570 [Cichorium endivia]